MTGLEIAGIISAAGGAIAGGTSTVAGIKSVKKQKKLMAYQDKINDENYDKQLSDQRQLISEDRQYNSIGAQIERAKNAGISPLAALGVSTPSSLSASTPSQDGVSIPSDPSAQYFNSAATAFQGAESSLRSALLGSTQRKQEELKLKLSIDTYDANVKAADLNNSALQASIDASNAATDNQPVIKEWYEKQSGYYKQLADSVEKKTPYEIENIMADYANKTMEYFNKELDVDLKQATFVPSVQQFWLNCYHTLTASELNRASALSSIENAKSGRLSAYADLLGVAENRRHNLSVEDIQQQHEDNSKAFQDLTIEIERGELDQKKLQTWLDLGTKVVLGSVGAGVGFFIGGPMGAAVGASLGLGINIGSTPQDYQKRNRIGYR